MVDGLGELFVNEPFDVREIKNALFANPFLAQIFQHKVLEFGVKPLRERNGEASFLPINNASWQQAAGSPL